MRRDLLRSTTFIRAAKKLVSKTPKSSSLLLEVLEMLSDDAFHPSLKTHKLKNDREGNWSCTAAYDLRIIFRFVKHEGKEAILLKTIGTHDEVY